MNTDDKTLEIYYIASTGHDCYDEDEQGRELHTITRTNTLRIITCKDFKDAKRQYNEIMEANADNPPYDIYKVLCICYKKSKEILPKQMFYGDDEVE